MNIISSSYQILEFPIDVSLLEKCGRVCYQSEPKGQPEKFVKKIIDNGHHSVIEHLSMTVKLICDRGVLAELSRHRLISLSVESTRYCRYDDEITVIKPLFIQEDFYADWYIAMSYAEKGYLDMLKSGATPQEARSVLPMSLKTELVMTANLREMLHIFNLRCAEKSHPDLVALMRPLLKECYERLPVVFEDVYMKYCSK